MSVAKVQPIRLLLVDDHRVVLVGLRTVLQNRKGITVVGESVSRADAVRQAKRLNPDVVLMDVRLPDGSGVDACREILSSRPATRVIFLTSYADDDSVLAAVMAGAQGYVLKDINAARLVQSIRAVFNGRSLLTPAVSQQALNRMKTGLTQADPASQQSLAPQEERVLALVAEGLTNKAIAVRMKLSDKTVKNYLANIFEKLRISRRAQAAVFFVERQGRRS